MNCLAGRFENGVKYMQSLAIWHASTFQHESQYVALMCISEADSLPNG